MEISKIFNLAVCYQGLQRSVGLKNALQSIGIPADHFEGGTHRMKEMGIVDITKEIPLHSLVTVIFDPGDDDLRKEARDIALGKLKIIKDYGEIDGIQTVNTTDIYAKLYGLKVNPLDFMRSDELKKY